MSKIPILMYHSIADDNFFLSVSKKNFYNQLNFLKKLGYESINFDNLYTAKKKNFIITFDDGYKDNLTNALPILKEFNYTATSFIVCNKIGQYNEWDKNHEMYKKKTLMSIEDINQWLSSDCHIGSHTLNHVSIKNINFINQKNEIIESKIKLSKIFNKNINVFSYPYGKFDNSAIDLVKKNFDFAVTTLRSRFDTNKHSPYLIPRIPINSDTSLFKLAIKILSIYEDAKYKNDF
jgi:peptidoglycan/xylan/chitin deacetylase (PgdA/CDA1 family)